MIPAANPRAQYISHQQEIHDAVAGVKDERTYREKKRRSERKDNKRLVDFRP